MIVDYGSDTGNCRWASMGIAGWFYHFSHPTVPKLFSPRHYLWPMATILLETPGCSVLVRSCAVLDIFNTGSPVAPLTSKLPRSFDTWRKPQTFPLQL